MNFGSVIILFIIGIILIRWGINIKLENKRLFNKCVNKCEGILIKINEKEMDHVNINNSNQYKTKSYVPIYQYCVEGKLYRIKGTNGSGFKVGDVVEINYNPENPSESYIEGYSLTIFWKMLLLLGIIFIIGGLNFLF